MRLLYRGDSGELAFTKDFGGDDPIPCYAILSHTWEEDQEQEVTFQDLKEGIRKKKNGYEKIQFCRQQAERDRLRYFWVDTCCINKIHIVELQGAINSMFRWYRNATKYYVYLRDVSTAGMETSNESASLNWESAFRNSRWFTRGWTLQELLAPRSVEFFSREHTMLGDKRTLEQQIHEITGIPTQALQGVPLRDFKVEERLSWIIGRKTHWPEDKAYSLMGMFSVFLKHNYGEGEENAFKRLKKQIDKAPDNTRHFPRPTPAATVVVMERADKLAGRNAGEIAWSDIMERRRRNNTCLNCGSYGHGQYECENSCGKC
ncbi:hypothetical protein N0V90_000605 [Kalmusia sp. IMI 367209]|nr:hypothetical protein N0V90_000605 [Kalmusia sp. IMI 367209]